MKDLINYLENRIYEGYNISFDEALELHNVKDVGSLYEAANRIKIKFQGNIVDLCSIMNAKCGKCSEDCKYCAQSIHYNTGIKEHGLVKKEEAVKLALENEEAGVKRFSLVTSGRGIKGKEFDEVLDIYKNLKKNCKIFLCASLGIIGYEQLVALKSVGVDMYHHNLESSRAYYEKICSTHSYDERISTINNAKKAGLKICSGGIIGMGECVEDRINLAFQLKNLNVKSIPINILNPIKGTPLENTILLKETEILKTIAIFRFINVDAYIRLAAGRNFLNKFGQSAFLSGANATITGNYLTTSGNTIKDDIKMISKLGLNIDKKRNIKK